MQKELEIRKSVSVDAEIYQLSNLFNLQIFWCSDLKDAVLVL